MNQLIQGLILVLNELLVVAFFLSPILVVVLLLFWRWRRRKKSYVTLNAEQRVKYDLKKKQDLTNVYVVIIPLVAFTVLRGQINIYVALLISLLISVSMKFIFDKLK